MPDLSHIEPERRKWYTQLQQLQVEDPQVFDGVAGKDAISLIEDLQRAREGCRKALTCASIPDSVRQVIVEALASARAAKGAEQ